MIKNPDNIMQFNLHVPIMQPLVLLESKIESYK